MSPWTARISQILVAIDSVGTDSVHRCQRRKERSETLDLGGTGSILVEVADQSDADIASVERVVAGVGSLVLERAPLPDAAIGTDQIVVADISPLETAGAVVLDPSQVGLRFSNSECCDGRLVCSVMDRYGGWSLHRHHRICFDRPGVPAVSLVNLEAWVGGSFLHRRDHRRSRWHGDHRRRRRSSALPDRGVLGIGMMAGGSAVERWHRISELIEGAGDEKSSARSVVCFEQGWVSGLELIEPAIDRSRTQLRLTEVEANPGMLGATRKQFSRHPEVANRPIEIPLGDGTTTQADAGHAAQTERTFGALEGGEDVTGADDFALLERTSGLQQSCRLRCRSASGRGATTATQKHHAGNADQR